MKLKSLQLEERPRERLSLYGVKTLTNAELLAILLRSGYRKKNAVDLSREILKKHTLRSLNRITPQELMILSGVGFSKACSIIAAAEVGQRAQLYAPCAGEKISSPAAAVQSVKSELQHADQEMLVALLLNSREQLLSKKTIFIGTIDKQLISTREIAKEALKAGAKKIILAHNHPSGSLEPSDADIVATEKISRALGLLDLDLLDHIIVCNNRYLSFREKKLL